MNSIIWAVLRAWYGGQYKNTFMGNHRGLQTAVMIAVLLPMFIMDFNSIVSICTGVAVTLWVQFQFWSRGHGPAFDIGTDDNPSQGTIKRYTDRWFNKVCEKLIPEEYWYDTGYDMLWMGLRYTMPLLVPAIVFAQPLYLAIGLTIPFIYLYSWNKHNTWYPAEYMMGALFGLIVGVCRYVN